ncbi:hypothetical protein KCP75_12490 [Salmonella enterica subsp. enterica]|nr:hypothetical protein KCP75_12490 [Salmonella enterica subsp. enterica]
MIWAENSLVQVFGRGRSSGGIRAAVQRSHRSAERAAAGIYRQLKIVVDDHRSGIE